MLNTGERVTASILFTYGYTLLNDMNIKINIIIHGIITIKAGQLTHAIDIIIPNMFNIVEITDYAYLKTFVSKLSVSLLNLFNILPYGVVSKNAIFVLNNACNI